MTLDAIMRLAFGYADVKSAAEVVGHSDNSLALGMFIQSVFPQFIWKLMPVKKKYDAVVGYLHSMVDLVVDNGVAPKGSIIEALKLASDPESKEKLSSAELKDESLSILLAGHETTANTLGWVIFLLTRPENHKSLEKLIEEVDAVLGKKEEIGFDDFEKMVYCQSTVMESLRMYPTVPFFSRHTSHSSKLGGYEILNDSTVLMSNVNLSFDPRTYDHPNEFIPERHLDTLTQDRKRDFFPFGGGHRMCIGKRLAQVESVMILAKLMQCFRIERANDSFAPMLTTGITLSSSNGILVKVTKRF